MGRAVPPPPISPSAPSRPPSRRAPRRVPALLAATLVLVPAAGCSTPGKAIRGDFTTYNETIRYNQSQQMLLNLVRLKYRESLMFLKVGALSASYSFEGGADATIGKIGDISNSSVHLGAQFANRPTITYTPVEGQTFVKQVLTEVAPETFVLLVRSGWPIDKLCHVMVESIGEDINNEEDPSYERFIALVQTLRESQKRDELEFVQEGENPLLRYTTAPRKPSAAGEDSARSRTIPATSIHLRSFLDIMFFLAKNTEVPPEYADRVKETTPNGWMNIHVSSKPPDNALVVVRHDGYYYSIAHNDIQSKDIFALLKLLFQVQAGDIKAIEPTLTLPVAAP